MRTATPTLGSLLGRALRIAHWIGLVLALPLALALTACGDDCVDEDGDGFGRGCAAGDDCDDTLATRAFDCSSPPPDCEADPFAKGCACLAGERRECYAAAPETLGVSACRAGEQDCPTGAWTECVGAVLPRFDVCNDVDDDCDGVIDEAVRSPCGGCDSRCTGGVWGEGPYPFEPGTGLELSARGELTLALRPLQTQSVFVPNTGESTVSRIDPESVREVARYATRGEGPERIAIDYLGDAWVLDPSREGRAMLTRIASDLGRCDDRDGDGLQTSRAPSEVLASDDCVLLQRAVGREGEGARALAVSGLRGPDDEDGGRVYVGFESSQRLAELDAATGDELRSLELPGFSPYVAAFDPWGTLWLLDRAGVLARVEPARAELQAERIEAQLACYLLESLAIDRSGMLTLTGAACESITRYEPARGRFRFVETPGVLDARAVTTLDDTSWVTHTAGRLSRVAHEPLELLETYSLGSDGLVPFESTAISADSKGVLWVVSSMGAENGMGMLTRFDTATEQVTSQIPVGFLPRPLGDMTGERRFGTITPEASASRVFLGCGRDGVSTLADGGAPDEQASRDASASSGGEAATEWLRLHLPAIVDASSSVIIEARHAVSEQALASASFVELGRLPDDASPLALDFPSGGVVEVRLTLRSTNALGGPRIARVGLEWRCPGPD